jgi:hypothetical protein
MSKKINCWEFKHCERQPGGRNEQTMGTCPAAAQELADGIHGGKNGGRACWALTGTLCGGQTQGSFAAKLGACRDCDFYQLVHSQEPLIKDNSDILYQIGYKIGD